MKIIYHGADLDGVCSAAIVYWRGQHGAGADDFIGMDYGDDMPWGQISSGETVWCMDFCIEPIEEMHRLGRECNLVLIDHHKSTLRECRDEPVKGTLVLNDETAACELVWNVVNPDTSVASTVRYLSLYDIWKRDLPEWRDLIVPFQLGMQARVPVGEGSQAFTHPVWEALLSPGGDASEAKQHEIVQDGRAIQAYRRRRNARVAAMQSQIIRLNGYRAVAINGACTDDSEVFAAAPRAPIMVNYYWVGQHQHWNVRMYTEEETGIDVSKIAEAYGGGGHRSAAGFECATLPFDAATSRRA